jgi:protein gp37
MAKMTQKTSIEWTDYSWNPVRGCSRVDSPCKNCYAEVMAARFSGPGQPYEGLAEIVTTPGGRKEARWTGKIMLIENKLEEPLSWRKPRTVFVNSMSDLFHDKVPDSYIQRVLAVIAATQKHTYQMLTKRADRLPRFFEWLGNELRNTGYPDGYTPISNLWLGVSVGIRDSLDKIDALRQTPAAVRFVSFEPLLEDLGEIDLTGIHQVIVGGESGPRARPMQTGWAESIYRQARAQDVAVFVKQHSEANYPRGTYKKLDCFPEHMRVREYPRGYLGQAA